ncbi:MAG: rod shape-determining protein RodA [Alphaproteobacteria bacterium]|nr:rod shape-determining protein RodA [Alphaproteobacteria bacterium]
MQRFLGLRDVELSLRQKLVGLDWSLITLLFFTVAFGLGVLYSAEGGRVDDVVTRQGVRFGIAACLMFAVALIDIRFWLRYAYAFYAVGCLLLVAVEVMGTIGMGAQRWVDIGIVTIQPSEVMKLALVLALARYFHSRSLEEVRRPLWLVPPLAMTLVPAALVVRQPDLGTALLLLINGIIIFFLAGVRLWKFALVLAAAVGSVPLGWQFLHGYQRDRILTFLDPERDPLGAGYHILQSKIALGAGGVFGRGYLQGTQSHLNFLPEKQTDFIFTMLAEEFGLIGGVLLILLYALLLAYAFAIALRAQNQFGRLLALGVGNMLFIYVFINIAMVTGLVPVVGIPLPLISYGGTAMVSLLVGFGFLLGVSVHRDIVLPRRAGVDAGA